MEERSEECDRPRNPTTPPNRPCATTHTASGDGSTPSRRSAKPHDELECQAEGVYLKRNSGQPLTARACNHGMAVWSRIAGFDTRKPGTGKLNPFDGCEWIRLCDVHKERYEDWMMAQQCSTNGCNKAKSDKVAKGTLSRMCAEHEDVCVKREKERGEDDDKETPMARDLKTGSGEALNRAMKLQKRASVRQKTPKRKRNADSEGEKCGTRSNSCDSGVSKDSSRKDGSVDTRLPPDRPNQEAEAREGQKAKQRRNSTGGAFGAETCERPPFELVKRPIRPLTVPLASMQMTVPVSTSTENEIIANKLDAIEERRDPERQWAKVNKYVAYAVRGFGTFTPTIGIGVYGLELQKAIRRQAGSLKYTLWDLKIRAPITNRVANGIALVSWGAEDGRNGTKDSIMLGDCFPMDSRNFDQHKLSGEKVEEHGKQPTTMHMFIKMARQQSRIYAAAYGSEHLNERLNAIDRMSEVHEECPEFHTVNFMTEMCKRAVYQYGVCVSEGFHYILGRYDEGVTLENSEDMHLRRMVVAGRRGLAHQSSTSMMMQAFGRV